MRGALLLSMTFALAALSGCAELVEDPQVQEAAAAAQDHLDEAQDQVSKVPGHVAGTVRDADGAAVAEAVVSLEGLIESDATDEDGSFAFVDLPAGSYVLLVAADGFVDAKRSIEVQPGLFTRPEITLEAVPAPEPYSEVNRFDAYVDATGVYFFGCSCDFDFDLAEGLGDLVVEAVSEDRTMPMTSGGFYFDLGAYADDEYVASVNGYGNDPMWVLVPGADLAEADHAYMHLSPDGFLDLGHAYTVYVTEFYHGTAPEGYSALEQA